MKRLMLLALCVAGCGGGGNGADMGGTGDVTMATGSTTYYVVNKLQVPQQRSDFAIDLNGDGRTDNQLGSIISALAAQNLDVQTQIDMAVSAGSVVLLLSVQSTSLTSGDMVGVTVYLGQKTAAAPDFMSGMGMFAVDGSQMKAAFFGKISASAMKSNNPVTTTHPVQMALKLPLIQGSDPLVLNVNGAHVQFTTGTDMASGKPGLLNGQLHGSIKNADIQNSIIPAVAGLLSARIAGCKGGGGADAGTSSGDGGAACTDGDKQIQSIFDVGGCTDTNGVMAMANDGVISVCEVAMNQIIMNVLAPDVQIYAADGTTYAPNKDNKMKDSLSLGLGFTAVQSAMFTGSL
jgi:hypothetical protein